MNIFSDPYEESGFINFSHSIGADMLVIGPHRTKRLAHFFGGIIVEDILNQVDCPIWALRLGRK